MTQGIISLGKAFPLDSLQRATVSPVGSVGASKCLRPFEVATGDPHLCTPAPGKLSRMDSSSGFSEGHFDSLIPLRVKSSAGWRHLIFNRPCSVTGGIRWSSWPPDFYEWEWRVTGKAEVIKMRTPVALPRMKSSYHFDNLISDDSPNSHFGDLGVSN